MANDRVHIEIGVQVHVTTTKNGKVEVTNDQGPFQASTAISLGPKDAAELSDHILRGRVERVAVSNRLVDQVLRAVHKAGRDMLPTEPYAAVVSWAETVNRSAEIVVNVPEGEDPVEYVRSFVLDSGDDHRWHAQTDVHKSLDGVEHRQVLSVDNIRKKMDE